MIIKRTPEQIEKARAYGGVYEFDLTPMEMYEAYSVMQRALRASDIAQAIANALDDSGMLFNFEEDWPERFGERYVDEFTDKLDGSNHASEAYSEFVEEFTYDKLRELGYDPFTMTKAEEETANAERLFAE